MKIPCHSLSIVRGDFFADAQVLSNQIHQLQGRSKTEFLAGFFWPDFLQGLHDIAQPLVEFPLILRTTIFVKSSREFLLCPLTKHL